MKTQIQSFIPELEIHRIFQEFAKNCELIYLDSLRNLLRSNKYFSNSQKIDNFMEELLSAIPLFKEEDEPIIFEQFHIIALLLSTYPVYTPELLDKLKKQARLPRAQNKTGSQIQGNIIPLALAAKETLLIKQILYSEIRAAIINTKKTLKSNSPFVEDCFQKFPTYQVRDEKAFLDLFKLSKPAQNEKDLPSIKAEELISYLKSTHIDKIPSVYLIWLKRVVHIPKENYSYQDFDKMMDLAYKLLGIYLDFRKLDTNKNGEIGLQEFVRGMKEHRINVEESNFMNDFELINQDQENEITFSELCDFLLPEEDEAFFTDHLKGFFLKHNEQTTTEFLKIFASLDTDRNGVISKQEFLKGMERKNVKIPLRDQLKFFYALDKDSNGGISFREFEAGAREIGLFIGNINERLNEEKFEDEINLPEEEKKIEEEFESNEENDQSPKENQNLPISLKKPEKMPSRLQEINDPVGDPESQHPNKSRSDFPHSESQNMQNLNRRPFSFDDEEEKEYQNSLNPNRSLTFENMIPRVEAIFPSHNKDHFSEEMKKFQESLQKFDEEMQELQGLRPEDKVLQYVENDICDFFGCVKEVLEKETEVGPNADNIEFTLRSIKAFFLIVKDENNRNAPKFLKLNDMISDLIKDLKKHTLDNKMLEVKKYYESFIRMKSELNEKMLEMMTKKNDEIFFLRKELDKKQKEFDSLLLKNKEDVKRIETLGKTLEEKTENLTKEKGKNSILQKSQDELKNKLEIQERQNNQLRLQISGLEGFFAKYKEERSVREAKFLENEKNLAKDQENLANREKEFAAKMAREERNRAMFDSVLKKRKEEIENRNQELCVRISVLSDQEKKEMVRIMKEYKEEYELSEVMRRLASIEEKNIEKLESEWMKERESLELQIKERNKTIIKLDLELKEMENQRTNAVLENDKLKVEMDKLELWVNELQEARNGETKNGAECVFSKTKGSWGFLSKIIG